MLSIILIQGKRFTLYEIVTHTTYPLGNAFPNIKAFNFRADSKSSGKELSVMSFKTKTITALLTFMLLAAVKAYSGTCPVPGTVSDVQKNFKQCY